MHYHKLPGELPHIPPALAVQKRLQSFIPYVREAKETIRPTWNIQPRRLFDFLLVQLMEGTGEFTIGGKRYVASAGDLFWIPPDTLHEMRGDAPGTLIQFIHFDLIHDPERSHWSANIPGGTTDLSAWPERMHPPIDDPIVGSWCGKLHGHNPAHVTEILRRIIMEYDRTQISNVLIAGLVLQLIGHLLGNKQEDSLLNAHHAKTIENAMRHIQLHNHEKLNIETLARQHGLSPTHFRKLFREHYRQSPRTAHLNAKMRTACDCLIYSDLNITEIADRLGFTNVHNFSRAFSKSIGQPPSAYRAGRSSQ